MRFADERAAVVDAHDDAAAVGQVGHARVGGNRQRLVRCRHRVHVVGLAAGGACRLERRAVPARPRRAHVALGRGQHVVALAEHFIGRRIAVSGCAARRAAPHPGSHAMIAGGGGGAAGGVAGAGTGAGAARQSGGGREAAGCNVEPARSEQLRLQQPASLVRRDAGNGASAATDRAAIASARSCTAIAYSGLRL